MKKIICYLRTVKYTFGRFIRTGEIIPYVSGHEYVEEPDGSLVCMTCGDKSISKG